MDQYKNELNILSNLSSSEAENKSIDIRNRLNIFKDNLPKDIRETEIVKDIIVVGPNDINEVIKSSERSTVYNLQNKVEVNVEATTLESTLYSGTKTKKTLVKKLLIPDEDFDDVYIYERIPKNIVSSINNIKLLDDFEVVESDPIIRKNFNRLVKAKPIEFSYLLDGEAISGVAELKTFVVPINIDFGAEESALEKEEYECGDNICSVPFEDEISCPVDCGGRDIPWAYIIIAIVVILIGIIYFNFYKGAFDFRKLTRGKNPFKNNNELESVKKFIKTSLDKNIDKKNITKALMHKGWNKKQIKYAFEEIEWEKKWALIRIEAPETDKGVKSLKKYIRGCRRARMDDNMIRNILSNKGWTEEQINKGFEKAKGWF